MTSGHFAARQAATKTHQYRFPSNASLRVSPSSTLRHHQSNRARLTLHWLCGPGFARAFLLHSGSHSGHSLRASSRLCRAPIISGVTRQSSGTNPLRSSMLQRTPVRNALTTWSPARLRLPTMRNACTTLSYWGLSGSRVTYRFQTRATILCLKADRRSMTFGHMRRGLSRR